MVIFRQAMSKYLKSPSTWIILILSLMISGFLAGYLPFDPSLGYSNAAHYGYSVILSTGVMTSMVSIFSSIFAGFKGASMFRDEIESGTFLVLLSKPISRNKIIFQKWLALQLIMILFALTNVVVYEIVTVCVDNYSTFQNISSFGVKSLSANIFKACGYIFLVLITMGLIFSSISMMISTKLSTTTTIGISIGIGVIIPITGMIGAFTQRQEYTQLDNKTSADYTEWYKQYERSQKDPAIRDSLGSMLTEINGIFDSQKDPSKGIYKIGLRTAEDDKFDTYFPMDLNYQLEILGALSTEDIITDQYKQSLTSKGIMTQMAPIIKTKKDNGFDYSKWSTKEKAEKDIYDKLLSASVKCVTVGREIANILFKRGDLVLTRQPGVKWTSDKDQPWLTDDAWRNKNYENSAAANMVAFAHALIFNPGCLFLDEDALAKSQKDSWIEHPDDLYSFENFQTDLSIKIGLPKDSKNKQVLLHQDQHIQDTYTYLMNLVANDRQDLIYTKLGDYVPKRTLLWCYLAFAIGLVPISLLIMRKKDFR